MEGNIGCGKSTLLTYFQNYSDTVEVSYAADLPNFCRISNFEWQEI